MDKYQLELIKQTEKFRPLPKYPTYPPYHKGLYLEDLFFKYFIDKEVKTKKYYLPIFWTTVYNDRISGLQDFLNGLNNEYEYFTICQHDDAVREKLPIKTTVYSAGGNRGNIPIPLVCSSIPEEYTQKKQEKQYLTSFVGSLTHPIRNSLYNQYKYDKDFIFKVKNWSPTINDIDFNSFVDITQKSKFTLCPRGYGKTSFRLYESLQLNSVPVYISDNFWLPFEKEINWDEFCVLVKLNEINNLKMKLLSINDEKYNKMLESGKNIWNKYFEINNICKNILKNI